MAQRSVKVYQVDVFTETLFTGNPAGVVLGAETLSESEMQALARELNNSDSAFVLPADGADHDVILRFFTPKNEVGFVGHATVAAHVARLAAGDGGTGTLRQKSRSGIQSVSVTGTADNPHVAVTIPPPMCLPPISGEQKSQLLDIFGIDTAALDPKCPILVTKRATTRLMIGLLSTDLLASLEPDLEALKRLTPHVGADGYLLFVRDAHGPGTFEARLFSPVLGIAEDPVSGNAHGMLGAYLVTHHLLPVTDGKAHLRGYQGSSMNRPGMVDIEVSVLDGEPSQIVISGTARIVFTTDITLPE
jgi:PhzF family phenazine biosynthesis protein